MKILLPIDSSSATQETLAWMQQFIDKDRAVLALLHVVEPLKDNKNADEKTEDLLENTEQILTERGFHVEGTYNVHGIPVEEICRFADQHQVDQILMSAHQHRGLSKLALGSVTQKVFQCANQPVVVLSHAKQPSIRLSHIEQLRIQEKSETPLKVLLPFDSSVCSKITLDWASRYLDQKNTDFYLLLVVQPVYVNPEQGVFTPDYAYEIQFAQERLAEAKQLLEERGFTVSAAEYRIGMIATVICEFADEKAVDQIIIGSHGHSGLTSLLLGSVSQDVFNRAKQPVLLFSNTKHACLEISHPEALEVSLHG